MQPLKVSEDKTYFLRDEKSFFWLGDTCWSAFTNISDEEWLEYLKFRAEQGFTVLQINTLPQWDRCGSLLKRFPFPTEDGARFDFRTILPEYFEHARWMCRQAVEHGFTLMLVVMWCNFVPGTWASKICADNIIPEELVEPIVKKICESFNEFSPVYAVSGDTGFEAEETVKRYHLVADLVDQYAPDAMKVYHIKGRYDGLPQEFGERADAYLYQSGHNIGGQHTASELAETFSARTPKHPVVNSEPCYEMMGYSHHTYGRFYRRDTRVALWNSLLSGAHAGITYGAHGVWNWWKKGMPKNPIGGEGFLQAMPAERAVQFPGAKDFAFARRLFEERGITSLTPCQEIVAKYPEHIRAARTEHEILLYVPVNAPFSILGDYEGYKGTVIDLTNGETQPLLMHCEGTQAALEMHSFYEDALIVLEKVQ